MTLSENSTQIGASIILFLATLLVGTLPVYVFEYFTKRIRKQATDSSTIVDKKPWMLRRWLSRVSQESIVQFLTQLGGGVLLYTALIHMLPEIRDNYRKYQEVNNATDEEKACNSNPHETFPLVDIIACVGFFGMFLIEELMHTLLLKNHHHHYREPETSNSKLEQKQTLNVNELHHHHHHHDHDHNPQSLRKETIISISSGKSMGLVGTRDKLDMGSQTNLGRLPIGKTRRTSYSACELTKIMCEDGQIDCKVNCSKENLIHGKLVVEKNCSVKARLVDCIFIILAFSCHSIFDGISIGVQRSNEEVWQLLIAILSHKLIIAFILSFQIYDRCQESVSTSPYGASERRPIKYSKLILWSFSTLFALMSPIGIYIVIIMNNVTSEENSFSIIMLAAASVGTILYIVFVEILDKTSVRVHITGLAQWAALVIGFIVMHAVSTAFKE